MSDTQRNLPVRGHQEGPGELIDKLVASLTDWRGTTLAGIRRVILEADADIVEEWKWMGAPVWSHDGMVCLANAFKDKVKLTFYAGAQLPDPDNLFNNGLEGKQWRTIDYYRGDEIKERPLKALIQAAVAYNASKLKAAAKLKTAGRPRRAPAGRSEPPTK
jgi:hypothetical protein